MFPTEKIVERLKEENPELSETEIREFVEEKKTEFRDALEDIGPDDFAEELANRSHQEVASDARDVGMYGMWVLSQRDQYVCSPCLDHDGTVYTMEEVEEQNPLPHDDCENEECRCDLMPIPDQDGYEKMKQAEPDLSNLYD